MIAAALAVLLAAPAAAAPEIVFEGLSAADAEIARAEAARSMAPADVEEYLDLEFERPLRLSPVPLPPPGAGFGLDRFETSAALAAGRSALDGLKPRSNAVRDHLAAAALIRVVARDLGEPAAKEVLERRAFSSLRLLPAVVAARRARESAKKKTPLAELEALRPLRLDDAEAALAAGDRALARASADAAGTPAGEEDRRRLAAVYVTLGVPEKARALLPAPPLVDLAANEAAAGRKENALAALKAARAGGLDPAAARRELELRAGLGDAAANKALLESSAASGEPGPQLALAELAAREGDAAEARRRLASAAERKPTRADRRRAALVLQSIKDYDKACEEFARLYLETKDAAILIDDGVCEFMAGRLEKAEALFETATKLDPASVPARSSLDAVRASLKKAPSGAR